MQAVEDALRTLAQDRVDARALARARAEKEQYSRQEKNRRHKLEQQLENARRARLGAYKDKTAGLLSAEEFTYISQSLRTEENRCRQELDRLAAQEAERDQTARIEQKIRAFLQFDHLEKSQLQQLVRRVEVDADKQITITFCFTDPRKGAD